MTTHRPRRLAAVATCLAAAVLAPVALAATKNGITPQTPKVGARVPTGSVPTFKGRVRGKGVVYVYVCKSRRRDRKGLICSKEMIKKAKRRGTRFSVKAPFFNYPAFWLNSPGTYYWQAHRIDCRGNLDDCSKEGPVVRFRVR